MQVQDPGALKVRRRLLREALRQQHLAQPMRLGQIGTQLERAPQFRYGGAVVALLPVRGGALDVGCER